MIDSFEELDEIELELLVDEVDRPYVIGIPFELSELTAGELLAKVAKPTREALDPAQVSAGYFLARL